MTPSIPLYHYIVCLVVWMTRETINSQNRYVICAECIPKYFCCDSTCFVVLLPVIHDLTNLLAVLDMIAGLSTEQLGHYTSIRVHHLHLQNWRQEIYAPTKFALLFKGFKFVVPILREAEVQSASTTVEGCVEATDKASALVCTLQVLVKPLHWYSAAPIKAFMERTDIAVNLPWILRLPFSRSATCLHLTRPRLRVGRSICSCSAAPRCIWYGPSRCEAVC